MNHLDLFSGIGGFSLGLHQAGIKPNWIGFSDIDKHANKVFKRRFPNAEQLGDIKSIRPGDLPNIDLVTFGFPCQDLSLAGKRGGLQANRSSLFFEAIEIVKVKRPKYFIFENVKGLFSSNGGKDFDIVLREIADIGYDGQWQLVNTRWFLPQNRERVYFIGHIRGESRPKVFPICENEGEDKGSREEQRTMISNAPSREYGWKDVSPTLCARDYKDPKLIADFRNDEGLRIRKDGVAPCLPRRRHSETDVSTMPPLVIDKVHCTQQRGSKRPSLTKSCDCGSGKLYQKCCGTAGGSGHISRDDGNTYCLDTANSQAVEYKTLNQNQSEKLEKLKVDSSVSGCLTEAIGRGGSSSEYLKMLKKNEEITGNIRRLTPIECERLQGFPDNWTDEQSDTQRYKQCGNAVSVPVVKAIMEKLYV